MGNFGHILGGNDWKSLGLYWGKLRENLGHILRRNNRKFLGKCGGGNNGEMLSIYIEGKLQNSACYVVQTLSSSVFNCLSSVPHL